MPTYRFDIRDGRTIFDPHGIDLPDDDAARHYGEQLAQGLGLPLEHHGRLLVDVIDEDGNVIATYKVV